MSCSSRPYSSATKFVLFTVGLALATLTAGVGAAPQACVALFNNNIYVLGHGPSSWISDYKGELSALETNSTALDTIYTQRSAEIDGICVQSNLNNTVYVIGTSSTAPPAPSGPNSTSLASQHYLSAFNTDLSKWDSFPVTYKSTSNSPVILTSPAVITNIPDKDVEMLFVINYKLGFFLYEFLPHTSSGSLLINVTELYVQSSQTADNMQPQQIANVLQRQQQVVDPATLRGAGIAAVDDTVYVFGGNSTVVWSFNTSVAGFATANLVGGVGLALPSAGGIATVLPGTKIICFFSFGDNFKNVYRLDTQAPPLIYQQLPITGSFPNFNASSPMSILPGNNSDIYIYNAYEDQWIKYTESLLGNPSWITLPSSPSKTSSQLGPNSRQSSTSSTPTSIVQSESSSGGGGVSVAAIAGGVGGGVGAILIVVAILLLCRRKASKPKGVLAARGYAGVDDDNEETKYAEYLADQTYQDPIQLAGSRESTMPLSAAVRTNSVSDSIFRMPSITMAEILSQYRPTPTVYDNWSETDATPISPAGTVILGRYALTDGPAVQLNASTALRSATDASTGEALMLKFSADPAAYAREMAIVSYLASPQIVAPHTTYELRTATQYRYISVSEYSPSLDQLLPTIDADDAFFLKLAVKSLAECLRACHAKRIVHLDFTPQNLVHEPGDVTTWRLVNFEAASVVGDRLDRQTVPITSYSAPEVIKNPGPLGRAVEVAMSMDMWSLGCIVYEMCARRPLFPGGVEEVRRRTQGGWIVPSVEGFGNKSVEKLLNVLLVVDPKGRMSAEKLLRLHAGDDL